MKLFKYHNAAQLVQSIMSLTLATPDFSPKAYMWFTLIIIMSRLRRKEKFLKDVVLQGAIKKNINSVYCCMF